MRADSGVQRAARDGEKIVPRALITGITGQDGSYLAEFLLDKGYDVFGTVRRTSGFHTENISHLVDKVTLLDADLVDQQSINEAVQVARPDEVYNLAAMSFVGVSFKQPIATAEYTGASVVRVLEAVRQANWPIRFYQASTSEMFGKAQAFPQSETTPFYPRSPYAASKLYGHWMTVNYRESYGMHASSGILFNHEGPRRGREFVTRKITQAVARITLGLQSTLALGNLHAKRDWGFAGDYVRAMWLMLQQETPDDYVIATGESHSVEEFVRAAFAHVGVANWQDYVVIDPQFIRPAEVDYLLGDPSKARRALGWQPEVTFEQLVAMMMDADLARIAREHGLPVPGPSVASPE
jgi:GDPmannose 4,6-dehydratase